MGVGSVVRVLRRTLILILVLVRARAVTMLTVEAIVGVLRLVLRVDRLYKPRNPVTIWAPGILGSNCRGKLASIVVGGWQKYGA